MPENKDVSLKDLFKQIMKNNLEARTNEGAEQEKAHKACKSAVLEVIVKNYGVMSDTFKAMLDIGTDIGCGACMDTYNYAQAWVKGKTDVIEQIEKKYGTHAAGCGHCPG